MNKKVFLYLNFFILFYKLLFTEEINSNEVSNMLITNLSTSNIIIPDNIYKFETSITNNLNNSNTYIDISNTNILFQLPLSNIISNDPHSQRFYSIMSNIIANMSNKQIKPEFLKDINISAKTPYGNIIVDSYDEVSMQGLDNNRITEIKFSGNVIIRFENNQIKARTIIVSIISNKVHEISAYDKIEFKYGNDIYLAESLSYNPEIRRGILYDVRSFLKGGGLGTPIGSTTGWYYHSDKATILSENKIIMENVTLTFTPDEFPHYRLFSKKIWYFKNDIVFLLDNTYTVGNADFFYIPVYFRWERISGINTAFGKEKRIGWYFMNTFNFDFDYGFYKVGLDIYERLGEFAFVNFRSKKLPSYLKTFNVDLKLADDIRVFYNPKIDNYSQFVYVNNTWTNIRQFAWEYSINGSIGTKDTTINFNWYDLNDPFFVSKYNNRKETMDFMKDIIQSYNNSFYSHSDLHPVKNSFSRGFSLNYGSFNMSGNWTFNRIEDTSISNRYINERHKFYLYNYTFPNISYTMPAIPLIENIKWSIPISKTINISNTNFQINVWENPNTYVQKFIQNITSTNTNIIPNTQTNININTNDSNLITIIQQTTNTNFQIISDYTNINFITLNTTNISNTNNIINNLDITNILFTNITTNKLDIKNIFESNFITQTITTQKSEQEIKYTLTTNYLDIYKLSSVFNANLSYQPNETVDTNGKPVSDNYHHVENGSISLNIGLINNLLSFNNSLSFMNRKRWSSFEGDNDSIRINNENYSGYEVNYSGSLGFSRTFPIFEKTIYQINLPFTISHGITYQLFRTTYSTTPLEMNHNTTFNTGFNFFNNNITYNLGISHSMKYMITNDLPYDNYINNMIARNLNLSTSFKFFWITLSTGFGLNILETISNNYQKYLVLEAISNSPTGIIYTTNTNYVGEEVTNYIEWSYNYFTNRLIGMPKLNLTFSPPSQFAPLPSITFVYDIIRKTNEAINLSTSYTIQRFYNIPFIYKIETFNFNSSLSWNFLNPRATVFNMNYSTVIWFDKYWKLTFATSVRNNKIYRYFKENTPYFTRNETYVDFWSNLWDSINIFDYDGLKRGFFKIQGLSFDLVHYLNEWEMHAVFNINRKLDQTRMLAYWEPVLRIEFRLSGTQEQFPPYEKKFVPEIYQ